MENNWIMWGRIGEQKNYANELWETETIAPKFPYKFCEAPFENPHNEDGIFSTYTPGYYTKTAILLEKLYNSSVERQKGLTTSHLYTQLDAFAAKLTNYKCIVLKWTKLVF